MQTRWGLVLGVVLVLLVASAPAIALDPRRAISQYRLDVWGTEDGLPQSTVRAIVQTSDGYLWVGTQDGLARFNGASFTTYRKNNTPGLPSDSILALREDREGALWIGTTLGVVRYSQGRFSKTLNDRQTISLTLDTRGHIWAGEWNGVTRFDGEKPNHFPQGEPGIPGDTCGAAAVARRDGSMWIAGPSGRILRIADGHFSHQATIPFGVRTLHEDKAGMLWAGTRGPGGGLFRVEGKRPTLYGVESGLSDPTVDALLEDREGMLWVGTERGLNRFANGSFQRFTAADGLPSDIVLCLAEDREGNLWVGTHGGGLVRFRDSAFESYTTREGLALDFTRTVYESSDGTIWVGTQGNGVSRFKNGRVTNLTRREGLPIDLVYSIAEDRDGAMWFGAVDKGGLVRYSQGRFTHFTEQDGIAGWGILAMQADSSGTLWLGTILGGLQALRNGRIVQVGAGDGRPTTVFAMTPSRTGGLWLCSDNAVVRFQEGRFTPYPVLGGGTPHAIYEDDGGTVWVGLRDGGIRRLKDGEWAALPPDEALANASVLGLVEDEKGFFWLCTSAGILRIERGALERRLDGDSAALAFSAYNTLDGLKSSEFDAEGLKALRARDGRLWFATLRGLATVRPESLLRNSEPPPVKIESVVDDRGERAPEDGLRLPAGTRQIEFHYAGLSYVVPQRVRFKYMLEGFDADWIAAGRRNVAYYTQVPPGSYTFRVQACNNDGVWNEEGAALRLSLDRHWYQTGWWRGLVALLVGLAGYGAYQWRVAAHKSRETALALKVQERTAALQTEIEEHQRTEGKLQGEIAERGRAEEEARDYAEKLATSNVELTAQQEALERENEERRRAEVAARQNAEALSEANASLVEQQRALERENEERRRAEAAAGHERDLLHTLMDNIPDLIYFKDAEGRYTRVNRAHATALGLSEPEQALGHTDEDFFAADYALAAREDERRLVATGQPVLGKLEHDARAGRWYLATKVPISDGEKAVTGLVGISKDITERREAEERLARDLESFLQHVSEVAAGDLTVRAKEGEDTLGKIARAVNHMLEAFVNILGEVRDAAFSVSASSTEILAASNQIAKGAQFGRDQVLSTASAVDEMVASMGQVTKSAEQSARAAQQVLEHLLASDRAVDASGQGMTRIDAAVSETAEKMSLLSARSREVFEIINLIEEIASRSELLSINAAIEAAHAGDAGKGFGVVADEIRHLADRSIEATRSVTNIVQGMAAETQAVRDAMETSMREVKQGLDLSEQARHGLSEISALVQQATDLAGQISDAVHEQTGANQTVAEAMQSIGSIAEESSAGSKETARAVHDLVLLSEHLTKAIARFRIDRPEEHSTTAQASPATLDQIAQHLGRLVAHLNAGHAAPSPQANDGAETAQSLPALARDLGQLVEQLRYKW